MSALLYLAAVAAPYGPPATVEPAPPPAAYSPFLTPDQAERRRIERDADRWETAYLALSAIDAAQTCDFVARGVAHEANPALRAVLGKRPKCHELVAAKAVLGAIHYIAFREIRARDPKAARIMAQVSFATQGVVVGLNLRFTFRETGK